MPDDEWLHTVGPKGWIVCIVSLFRDSDRFPVKVVLKDVVPFYLCLKADRPRREESDQIIDWLVLTADEWHNIAFRVYRVEGETGDSQDEVDPSLQGPSEQPETGKSTKAKVTKKDNSS
jgi:hypothetical protein